MRILLIIVSLLNLAVPKTNQTWGNLCLTVTKKKQLGPSKRRLDIIFPAVTLKLKNILVRIDCQLLIRHSSFQRQLNYSRYIYHVYCHFEKTAAPVEYCHLKSQNKYLRRIINFSYFLKVTIT